MYKRRAEIVNNQDIPVSRPAGETLREFYESANINELKQLYKNEMWVVVCALHIKVYQRYWLYDLISFYFVCHYSWQSVVCFCFALSCSSRLIVWSDQGWCWNQELQVSHGGTDFLGVLVICCMFYLFAGLMYLISFTDCTETWSCMCRRSLIITKRLHTYMMQQLAKGVPPLSPQWLSRTDPSTAQIPQTRVLSYKKPKTHIVNQRNNGGASFKSLAKYQLLVMWGFPAGDQPWKPPPWRSHHTGFSWITLPLFHLCPYGC